MRQEIAVGGRVKTTVVLSGKRAWQNDGGPTTELSPRRVSELEDEADAMHLATLLPLLSKDAALELLPETKGDGPAADVVRVVRKGRPEATLTFDKKSGLLSRLSLRTTLAGEKVELEYRFGDYKDVEGMKTPAKETVRAGGKTVTERAVEKVQFGGKLEGAFARP